VQVRVIIRRVVYRECQYFRLFLEGRRDNLEDSAGKGLLSPRCSLTEEQNPGLPIAPIDLTCAASRKSVQVLLACGVYRSNVLANFTQF